MSSYRTRLYLHFSALVIEFIGTIFLSLDILRLNSRAQADALGVFGDPPPYHHWYFHCAPLGFGLIFAGILLAGVSLWLEHREVQLLQKSIPPS